ncbi:MAG: cation:proton antiporter [Gemmatimonadaceae bacterium]|nr:cation:proton antiporter [Gemmatimonadaceae bacterium]
MTTRRRSPALYALMVLAPVLFIVGVLQFGPVVFPSLGAASTTASAAPTAAPAGAPSGPAAFNLTRLVLQLVVILLAVRVVGLVAKRLGQPSVIGEMVAGILLGPSVFGALAPAAFAQLFPAASLPMLNSLAQLGVMLFLFVVGLHVDLGALHRQGSTALVASHASIAAPFSMGVALALWLYPHFAPSGVPFAAFALFIGVAMSITAFPVLARILEERHLLGTPIGTLAVACAAVDDVTAWMLLAIVVAIVKAGSVGSALALSLGGTVLFLLLMLRVVRPWLERLVPTAPDGERLPTSAIAVMVLVALVSAAVTEAIGVHALFGAFIAGAVMPRGRAFGERAAAQLSDLLVVLLLPLFFAYTGLRTAFVFDGVGATLVPLAMILAVAIIGKVGGTAVAARASGQSWRDAGMLGILMNTRGLMELVVLNIGLDLGVLSPALFAMMVIMALVTTMMTVPALSLMERR